MASHPRQTRFALALAGFLCLVALAPADAHAQESPPPVEAAAVVQEEPAAPPAEAAAVVQEEPAPPPADTVPPVISWAEDVVVTAPDPSGATVVYVVPVASDDVDGAVSVGCTPVPGAFFPVGTTTVTCAAQDAAGNLATPVAFAVTVLPPPPPPPTEAPPTEAPLEPTATPPLPTSTPVPPTPTEAPVEPTATPTASSPSPTPTAEPSPTPEATPTPPPPPPLALPWPPPAPFYQITGSGPLDGLAGIWGDLSFPISQEYGHTEFSLSQQTMYRYGLDYGLDGRAHPGIDVGMPAGTPLYAPVDAEVVVAGGTPYFTYYGNGEPGVGELLLRTASGHEVVLGHMGLIVVGRGEQVAAGQFVGLSGGDNGDHLHLEVREAQAGGGFRAVDPRQSFLIAALEPEATESTPSAGTAGDDISVSEPSADDAAPLETVSPTEADAAALPKADGGNVQTASASPDSTSDGLNGPSPGMVREPSLE